MTSIVINIPWPKDFPAEPLKLSRLSTHPDAITDSYAVDLYAGHYNCNSTIGDQNLDNLFKCEQFSAILPYPESKCHDTQYDYYVFRSADGSRICLQTKYYNYFYRKYGGVEFLFSSIFNPVLVRYNKEIVGMIMPILV